MSTRPVSEPRKARIEALSARLWTHGDASFLPHGTAADGQAARQPVWLCCDASNPNNANTLFLIDNAEAEAGKLAALEMVAVGDRLHILAKRHVGDDLHGPGLDLARDGLLLVEVGLTREVAGG